MSDASKNPPSTTKAKRKAMPIWIRKVRGSWAQESKPSKGRRPAK